MTIAEWLFKNMQKLHDAGVDSPRRDALVLLEDTLDKDRAWVVTRPEYKIPNDKLILVNYLIKRRLKREPLAYIRGRGWFYGRFFEVNPSVMIPRPESESFIEILIGLKPQTIIDIGTGSGCLAITANLECPEARIIAVDNSQDAIKIARLNARKHKTKIDFMQGNLLQPIADSKLQYPSSIILANLPYVPKNLITSPEVSQEPPEAIFSGIDGLDHYRAFFDQIAKNSQFDRNWSIDYILTESLESQHKQVIKLAQQAGYQHVKTDVLVQLFKVI